MGDGHEAPPRAEFQPWGWLACCGWVAKEMGGGLRTGMEISLRNSEISAGLKVSSSASWGSPEVAGECRWVQGHGADRHMPAVWGQANYVIHGVVRARIRKGRCNATELHSLTIRVAPVLSLETAMEGSEI